MFYFAYMLFQKYFALLGLSLSAILAEAQTATYPKDFRNPLDIPIMLAGNFGECRPNHFHSGIDIKTNGQENMAVYSVADGYIARIKMERGGFGHALYIAHPNGYTTLYAHLNDFMPDVQKFVRKEQYKKENWEVDLALQPNQFPVKKGQQIARSGNTGSSTAPHLHFEIRDSKTEHPLNPQLFGFDIKDTIAPIPTELAVYEMTNKTIYEQTPRLLKLQKAGDEYTLDTVRVDKQEIGLGLVVNDFMNGSSNTLNFYTATLYMNETQFIHIRLDDIGYDLTRYLHAFADYKTKQQSNKWVQCLFQLDGNQLNNIYRYTSDYRSFTQRGQLEFGNSIPKRVRIELEDAAGNKTRIAFWMIYTSSEDTATHCPGDRQFSVRQENQYSNKHIAFTLPETALYERLCLEYRRASHANGYSDRHTIHQPYVPVHNYFDLRIKPDKMPLEKDKIVMMHSDGKSESGKAAKLENGYFKASVRNFGEFWLVTDTEAPEITTSLKSGANLASAKRITFTAKDDVTSVKKFRAELDGKWLLFEQNGNNYFYEFDEHCPKGKHNLVVTATDENNNSKTLKYSFTR